MQSRTWKTIKAEMGSRLSELGFTADGERSAKPTNMATMRSSNCSGCSEAKTGST